MPGPHAYGESLGAGPKWNLVCGKGGGETIKLSIKHDVKSPPKCLVNYRPVLNKLSGMGCIDQTSTAATLKIGKWAEVENSPRRTIAIKIIIRRTVNYPAMDRSVVGMVETRLEWSVKVKKLL